MSIYDEPKIDCHNHVFDPARFPYAADTIYRPAGAEIGTPAQLVQTFDAYGVRHALIVGPNSGYQFDNRCLLDTLRRNAGRFKGIAVVRNDATRGELEELKAAGIVGCAMNPALYGVEPYRDIAGLLRHLEALDLFAQVQVQDDQLPALMPAIERADVRILIDHCGRPNPRAGIDQPGFRALLDLGRSGRAFVKLSGHVKYSREAYPYADTRPYVDALLGAFTLDACVWGSDWPFLRAPERIDYGPLLKLVEVLLPDAADRRKLLWDTPRRLFGFGGGSA
jgi:predicted TIM-barrel fold metal-dependent hydrolase